LSANGDSLSVVSANRTLLPIQCRVVSDLSEFDGSWTPWEGMSISEGLSIYPHS
jgi:distribution and morphology protein 31